MKKRNLIKGFTDIIVTMWIAVSLLSAASVSAASEVNLQETCEIATNEISGWPQGPEIGSDTGIVMDADTGVILYEKGADVRRYPASIVKLMTLLVAAENSSLEEQVTFTDICLRDQTADSSNIGMQVGEVMSMEDCLCAMILSSANEVSAQIAEHVGKTEADFVQMMNERAAELGCENTKFINASGLPGEGQYTTARDMALIFQAVLRNETARHVIETWKYTIAPTNLHAEERKLTTHHPMVHKNLEYYYEGCIGGKTGRTNDAGSTLVTGAARDGVTYIAVLLRDPELPQQCFDTADLFDYAYDHFQKTDPGGTGAVTVPVGISVEELETTDTKTDGEVLRQYYFQGRYMGYSSVPQPTEEVPEEAGDADEMPLFRETESSDEDPASTSDEKETEVSGQKNDFSDMTFILLGIMGIMIIVLLILIGALIHKKKMKKQRRVK